MKMKFRRLLAGICAAALMVGSASALTVEQAVALLEQYYVDELPQSAYDAQTLDELFAAIGDPYTYYMSAEEYKAFIGGVEGEAHVGVGIAITYTDRGIHINSVIRGGSAEQAGLVGGDLIVAVDGEPCVPARESDSARITGPEGTQVELTVLREDGSRINVTLERRAFTVPTTSVSLLENGSGYIDCDSFATGTGRDFAEGIAEYGDETDLWVVDVRGNLGGVSSGAVSAAGTFTGGPCILLYLRSGEGVYYPSFSFESALTDAPAVVLTDRYSASASEVFASAIKDYGAGIVVGGRTYGKGVAQIVLDDSTDPELFEGDALKITAYRFYSGAANTTDSVGVLPTLLVRDELINDVAELLHATEPEDISGWLRLSLGGWDFYIDADAAMESEDARAALAELFAALAPNVALAVGVADYWVWMSASQIAGYLELEYQSRWFADVDVSGYREALNTLAVYGILRGSDGRRFSPRGTFTRAELCVLLCQALDRAPSASPCPFSDVSAGSWYAPYVTAMYEMGLVKGGGDGKFRPDGALTQKELITVMGKLAEFLNAGCREDLSAAGEEELSDPELARLPEWSRGYAWLLEKANKNGSMYYVPLAEVDPEAAVMREEAGAALYSLLTGLGVLRF